MRILVEKDYSSYENNITEVEMYINHFPSTISEGNLVYIMKEMREKWRDIWGNDGQWIWGWK